MRRRRIAVRLVPSDNGFVNYRLLLRRFRRCLLSVNANAACRFVLVLALLPFFSTFLAYALVDMPERFALARNAPGRLIADLIHFFFRRAISPSPPSPP
jgi:hypothetical protein